MSTFSHDRPGILLLLALAVFLAGCGASDRDVVERKKSLELTRGELLSSIRYGSSGDSATASAIAIEDWKETASLYLMALENGQEQEPETRRLVERAKRQIVVQRYVASRIEKAWRTGRFSTDSAAVRQFFLANAGLFVFPRALYSVIGLYASDAGKCARMEDLLLSGLEDPDELLRQASVIDPARRGLNTRSIGGYRNYEPAASLAGIYGDLRTLIEQTPSGRTSAVVKIGDSLYVVLKVIDVADAGAPLSFRQAYRSAERMLALQKQNAFYDTLLAEARKKYP
jgi:hypothetical protein